MARKQGISRKRNSQQRTWIARGSTVLLMAGCFSPLFGSLGCQRLPGNQAFRQYQLESDRLLNEFRAQKKRADELETRNLQLEQRLAESEKQLALTGIAPRGRSSTNAEPELLIGQMDQLGRGTSSLSQSGSSRSSIGNKTSSTRSGLPEATPPIAGQFASGTRRDPISLTSPARDLKGDRNRESQWRPIAGTPK
jgi:hypothetical protein